MRRFLSVIAVACGLGLVVFGWTGHTAAGLLTLQEIILGGTLFVIGILGR